MAPSQHLSPRELPPQLSRLMVQTFIRRASQAQWLNLPPLLTLKPIEVQPKECWRLWRRNGKASQHTSPRMRVAAISQGEAFGGFTGEMNLPIARGHRFRPAFTGVSLANEPQG